MVGSKIDRGIKPIRLQHHATIGIVSPASCPQDEQIYHQGISYLKNLGYQVIEGEHVLNKRGYLAGEDDDRVNDLNKMFQDPDINAIICSRGGYGAPRIIDQIDFNAIRDNPKIFVGYSDITSFHLAIWKKTGLITFAGPMVAVEFGRGIEPFTENYFWKTLSATEQIGLLPDPPAMPLRIIKAGQTEGRLLGGCLSLINMLLGTPYCPDFQDAILLIEDIDEEPYRVDRYLAQLKLAGILDQVAGIVLGQFIDCLPKDPDKPSLSLDQVFEDYFGSLDVPIIANFAYGHIPVKHTLPIGVPAILDTENGGLIIPESAVVDKIIV